MRRLAFIFFLLLWISPAAGQENATHILRQAAEGMHATRSLEATFHQEKLIPFLNAPLVADGKLCFDLASPDRPYIFWEYRQPAQSGFQYDAGDIRLWTDDKTEKDAAGAERFLQAMVNRMLQWIAFDQEALEKEYTVESVPDPQRTLFLTPRKENQVFKRIQLEFDERFATLTRIIMTGPQDDSTILTFTTTSLNAPLSVDCQKQ